MTSEVKSLREPLLNDARFGSSHHHQVTGLINTVIDIWLLVNVHYLEAEFEPNEEYALLVPGELN